MGSLLDRIQIAENHTTQLRTLCRTNFSGPNFYLPLHVVNVNVPTSQRVRVLHHGLLHAGHIVGDDFVGVVLDGARRDARACRYRYKHNAHILPAGYRHGLQAT